MANKTIVSNPYTFNIDSNILFSTTINAVLPDKETILYEARFKREFINLTIPRGVNVVKVYCYAQIGKQDEDFVTENGVCSYVNDKVNKVWAGAGINGIGVDEMTRYVGVTSGKTYRLSVYCTSDFGSAYLSNSYSNKINAHAVDVEDY